MLSLQNYVRGLQALVSDPQRSSQRVQAALDGEPFEVLRSVEPIGQLRADGVFFSGSTLARRVLQGIGPVVASSTAALDPACGTGDLLVAFSARLPIKGTLSETLKVWGGQIYGFDIHQTFVRAARTRVALSAIARGTIVDCDAAEIQRLLPGIRVGSSLREIRAFRGASLVLMNPPFSRMAAPADCVWATGGITAAALFLEHALSNSRPGTSVVAILPEVLRSGSRYGRWRKVVEGLADVTRIETVGQFSPTIDIDVFLLVATTGQAKVSKSVAWVPKEIGARNVGTICDISVGALVPHRAPRRGPWRSTVSTGDLPPWNTVREANQRRRFSGTVVCGPFVAVRRTSRPGSTRVLATLVALDGPVAVENHLIVLKPKDGRLSTCRWLLKALKSPSVTEWLDTRIRCRHLTVGALSEVPLTK